MNYLFFLLSFLLPDSIPTPVESDLSCIDLRLMEIEEPDWNDTLKATDVKIRIKNKSRQTSPATRIRLRDLDPDKRAIKKLKLTAEFRQYLMETMEENIKDPFIEVYETIPPIPAGAERTITVHVLDYWLYDPNCEFEVLIDPDEIVEDCNRSNNWRFFASSQ